MRYLKSCISAYLLMAAGTLFYSVEAMPAADKVPGTPVTTVSLVLEMIELHRLAEFPDPPYQVFQVSSYDRRSRIFGGEHWFANSDGFGGEPIPGVQEVLRDPAGDQPGKYLLADVAGPGAIVRTWTARMNGEITIWLDGDSVPLFQGAANDFLQALYPSLEVEGGPAASTYAGAMTQRDAGYYPVPFAKRCRIEWTGDLDELHFYHIEFRRYDPETVVQSFSTQDLVTWKDDIQEVCELLLRPAAIEALTDRTAPKIQKKSSALAAGEALELAAAAGGPGKITLLKTRIRAENLNKALRQSILTIAFDRASRPQVEAPLGDFFGAAPGINPFEAVPMSVGADGWMTCRFAMPFAESMRASIENRSDTQVLIDSLIRVEDYQWKEESTLHFHGKWRVDHEMEVGNERVFDLPYILVNGRGRFVGCAAMLLNPAEGPHPSGSWWGEGDEKIFVDEGDFPAFFGTGSEDYFNYSWSSPDLFSHAYFGQPRNDGPGNGGFVSNNRWHILDDIPFRSRLSFYMEMFPHTRVDGFAYARISWFYAAPGSWDDHMPIFPEDIRAQQRQAWTPAAVRGASGAIFTQMEDLAGNNQEMILARPEWAGGGILSWNPEKEGVRLEMDQLNVPETGSYELCLVMLLSPDSGRFAVELDGRILTDSDGNEWIVDLYTPFHTMARRHSPGHLLKLEAGDHSLALVYRGKSPESGGAFIQGDFLWIRERQ